MRVIITGGAGFIGANLVSHLVEDGAFTGVEVIDDLSTGFRANLKPYRDVPLHEGSILDTDLLDRVFAGADAVVHLAARPSVPRSIADPVMTHEVNATGTLRVLEAARRAGGLHTVVASSSSVYGGNALLPKSETLRPDPLSPYAVSKLAAEAYAIAYTHCFDLPVLPFRFFNVFGPLQTAGHAYAAAVPTFLDAAVNGRVLRVHGDGNQTRDFTYVRTVTEVLARALKDQIATCQPVNLAFGTRRTINSLLQSLRIHLGRDIHIQKAAIRPGDVRHSQTDSSALMSLLPDIVPVDFEHGLRETVTWFKSQ